MILLDSPAAVAAFENRMILSFLFPFLILAEILWAESRLNDK
jgi:hypothetical protein